ncbi:MAG: ferrous iron transport protein B [Spirochaetota bacterium]
MKPIKTIALVGNPNCGKTTLFNILTGSSQRVGNYAGVSVERKEGFSSTDHYSLKFIDLPGLYGLSNESIDQKIASKFLIHSKPDLIVNVLDASNLQRHLVLTMQLLELNTPMMIVLNMVDQVDKDSLDIPALEKQLGVPITTAIGNKKVGIQELLAQVEKSLDSKEFHPAKIRFDDRIESEIEKLEAVLKEQLHLYHDSRWLAIKLLEDPKQPRRYLIDSIVNLPKIETILQESLENIQKEYDNNLTVIMSQQRFEFVKQLIGNKKDRKSPEKTDFSYKIDLLLTHRILGFPIFLLLIFTLFYLVFQIGAIPQDYLAQGFDNLSLYLAKILPDSDFKELLVNGVIAGVGAVMSFVPSMIILYMGMSIMEDSGYIARVSFLMDGLMNRFGLHGKSCIPLIMGFGCNVPAILSTRVIENEKDRIATIFTIPMMSCTAKLAVFTLLVNTFFSKTWAPFVLFFLYILGMAIGLIVSLLMKKTFMRDESSSYIMEIPRYHFPILRNIFINSWQRTYMYFKKAGTLILSMSILIWFATNYPNRQLKDRTLRLKTSYAGKFGAAIAPVMEPLGFNWQVGISLTTAFVAKEVFISTFVISSNQKIDVNNDTDSNQKISKMILSDKSISPQSSLALMVFFLIYAPCLATVAIMKRETNSWRWASMSVVFNTALAWVLAFITYKIGFIFY